MVIFKVLSILLMAAGFLMVAAAKWAVRKYSLDQKSQCNFENEMSEEELNQYKFNKAVVNFKMMGMLVALPGLILLMIVFK